MVPPRTGGRRDPWSASLWRARGSPGRPCLVGLYRRKYPCEIAAGWYVERRLSGRIRLIKRARLQDLNRLGRRSKCFGIHGETRLVHADAGSATTSTRSPGGGAGVNHRALDHSPPPPPQWVSPG